MEHNITYSDKVGGALLNLKVEEVFIISEKVKPENRNTFVEICKSYIERNFGHRENWEIIFSNDYSKLRKENRTI